MHVLPPPLPLSDWSLSLMWQVIDTDTGAQYGRTDSLREALEAAAICRTLGMSADVVRAW